ncbi:hypothetical protein HanOQP8_Chr01g0020531 [Helianthus annuus]|nr:hypothetical protein HanOQP8_Chr01g0020531 [Helianthus annuus]
MGARKDLSVSFSRLTQEEVEAFCMEWGIGLKFNPVAPGCDKSIDQCPSGSIALYCRHFEFSNLHHPFSTFVLNVLEYYRVSFGQIHPKGLARVLHFEVLCRASCYDPTFLLFRRFFRLAKNGDWFTFETSKVNTCLISSMVTTLGAWKDRFFWVLESIVPFKMVWRHPDVVVNEPEPSKSDLNSCFLKAIRECPSRVRPFPEHLLVLLGISKLWDKPDRDPVLMRSVMSALDFVKSDDTSDVVFTDAQAAEGDDAVARGSEHRFEDVGYASVPNVKGFTKTVAPKALTHRSARRILKSAAQSTSSNPVEFSDDIEISKGQGPDAENEKNSDAEGLSEDEVYVPNWSVKEYEELSKKKEKMKASMAAMKKDIDSFSKKEDAWVKKLKLKAGREALDVQKKAFAEEKEGLKASVVQATSDNQWLIEQGFQKVVTYLLHSTDFNSALGDVYTKLLNYGKHLGLVAGFKLHEFGQALEQSPLFRTEASKIFKESVHQMERLTYPM